MDFNKLPSWKLALKHGDLVLSDESSCNCLNKNNKYCFDCSIFYNTDKNGVTRYWRRGILHRTKGPAVCGKKNKLFYVNGVFFNQKWTYALGFGELKHYKDEVYYNVSEYDHKNYWKCGLRHRDDGPAIEYRNGDKEW